MEAVVQEAGNDGSITSIDALNVRLDNQVCCAVILGTCSVGFHVFINQKLSYNQHALNGDLLDVAQIIVNLQAVK